MKTLKKISLDDYTIWHLRALSEYNDNVFSQKGEYSPDDISPMENGYGQYLDGAFHNPYTIPNQLLRRVNHLLVYTKGTRTHLSTANGVTGPGRTDTGVTGNNSEDGKTYMPANTSTRRTFSEGTESVCFLPNPTNTKDYRFFIYESPTTTPAIQGGLLFAAQGSFTSGEKTVNQYELLRVSDSVSINPATNSVVILFYVN